MRLVRFECGKSPYIRLSGPGNTAGVGTALGNLRAAAPIDSSGRPLTEAFAVMKEALPRFKYHPDPIATGSIVVSDETCACCGRGRGAVYDGPVYSADDPAGPICPWCIASGEAANRYHASFADGHPLGSARLAKDIILEVTQRTPGYTSWQQDSWQVHCNDACAFHGDAGVDDLAQYPEASRLELLAESGMAPDQWARLTAGYKPGRDPAFYKFICLHCAAVRLVWDCS